MQRRGNRGRQIDDRRGRLAARAECGLADRRAWRMTVPDIRAELIPARVEQLMRAGGYPQAVVEVQRTVDEALKHAARWTVRRDGPEVVGHGR